jgi:hypothetical protein
MKIGGLWAPFAQYSPFSSPSYYHKCPRVVGCCALPMCCDVAELFRTSYVSSYERGSLQLPL